MTDAVSARPLPDGARHSAAVVTNDLNLHYGRVHMLKHISLSLPIHRVTAFIGPSGCGKSTLLRCFNRMNDLIDDCRVEGLVQLHGEDVYDKSVDVADLRRRVGMVFQQPNPFPKSIFDNVAYGLRLQGMRKRDQLYSRVEWALRGAALWEETRHRLNRNAMELSGGQQQRLIIARAIAVQPDVLLLDEPASALDPLSTLRIEELVNELKQDYTIVIVTHNMQQAARIADYTAFLDAGEMVEYGETDSVFTNLVEKRTEDYITGRDS